MGFGRILNDPAEAEIAQLSHPLLKKYIGGLNIAMDNALLRKSIISQHKMPHEDEYLILAEPICFVPLEVGFEIAVVAVLQHEVEVFLVAEAVVELYDERGR